MWATLLEPDACTLEISEELRQQAWSNSRSQSYPGGCWTAYLNGLAVESMQTLLQEDLEQRAAVWPNATVQPEIRDVVNGAALTLGNHRLIVIPSESIDMDEISIPQEWVDIPSWAGDYYVAVKLDPTEEHLQVLGYATHQQLKAENDYDAFDRTYDFPVDSLIHWDNFSLTYQTYRAAETRAAILPVAPLSAEQTDSLVQRLGKSSVLLPRLEIPFQQWAALLEDDQARKHLYQARCGTVAPATQLTRWLSNEFQALWETVDSLVAAPRWAQNARSSAYRSPKTGGSGELVFRAKQLSLSPGTQVVLSVGIAPITPETYQVVLKIDPTKEATDLPTEIALRLLSLDGEQLGQASAAASETIRMQFRADLGEQFKVEVASSDATVQETFTV